MKALTLHQPWAHLVITGRKSLELRTWEPRYEGRILIHAGKRVVDEACRRYGLDRSTLVTGAIVGSVEVTGVVRFTPESWYRLASEHLDWGRFEGRIVGWRLRDPRRLETPIPWSGSLGLFEVPDERVPTPHRS